MLARLGLIVGTLGIFAMLGIGTGGNPAMQGTSAGPNIVAFILCLVMVAFSIRAMVRRRHF